MTFFSILLTALAVSLDAMAAGAVHGSQQKRLSFAKASYIAFFFGFFQMFMPLLGWIMGSGLEKYISFFDHWTAFVLLSAIGVKMIRESFKLRSSRVNINNWKVLILLSIATSIDALVVGVSFAFLYVNIWLAASTIGITTFLLSLASIYIGKKFGNKWGRKATAIGGLILVFIGVKILISHLI